MKKKKKYLNNKIPEIIYILPFNFDYKVNASMIFDETKEEERIKIIKYFNDNNIKNIYFNDIELFEDGIHLNYDGNRRLAEKVFGVIYGEF